MYKLIFAVALLAVFVSANVLPKANPAECSVCEYAVTYLEKQIEANATTSAIVAELEKVCTYAPTSLKQTCDTLIEMYAPQIIYQLINKETPEAICKALSIC